MKQVPTFLSETKTHENNIPFNRPSFLKILRAFENYIRLYELINHYNK